MAFAWRAGNAQDAQPEASGVGGAGKLNVGGPEDVGRQRSEGLDEWTNVSEARPRVEWASGPLLEPWLALGPAMGSLRKFLQNSTANPEFGYGTGGLVGNGLEMEDE
ncbi:hypothetical protein HIM_01172 [Hirsutella minnesotensis 3608]|nr:hypothetical protein HIM_01172 [Hirsutella minnesotensis 3608]